MKKYILTLSTFLIIISSSAQQIANELNAPFSFVNETYKQYATTVYVDNDNNGVVDVIYINTNNPNGQPLITTHDSDADGIPESIYTYQYDFNGNNISYLIDNDADGNTDNAYYYTYDENNNILTYRNDSNGDGIPETTITYTYDSNGNLITKFHEYTTGNRIITYTYDSNGNLILENDDTDNDGIVDKIITRNYDANGNLISLLGDYNGDGVDDQISTFTYDTHNNLLTETYDNDGDGIPNTIQTYTYDSEGNKITFSVDNNGDGVLEALTTYIYDADNNLLSESIDLNVNGIINQIETYTYDVNGNNTIYIMDTDGDGNPDEVRTLVYDIDGNILYRSYDFDGDGSADYVTTINYSYTKSCPSAPGLNNKMYKVYIPSAGNWVFSTCADSTDFDTRIFVGSTPCSLDLGSNSNACTSNKAEVEIYFNDFDIVYVVVAGDNNEVGTFELRVSSEDYTPIRTVEITSAKIYPNPAKDRITIELEESINSTLNIMDISGRMIQQQAINGNKALLDISNLPTGMFIYRVNTATKTYTGKFIKE